MAQVLAQLCFAPGAVDGALLSRLIAQHDLGFEPRALSCDVFARTGVRFGEEALARLAAAGTVGCAAVSGGEGHELSLGGIAGRHVDQLIWRTDGMPSDLSLVEAAAALPGFTAGHLSDAEDVFWQSESSIATYESRGVPHDALPKIAGGFFPGEDEEIDISRNPGRRVAVDGMWLIAAATMWFGAGAFGVLDRDRLRALPVGDVEERPDGVIRIELFPFAWYGTAVPEVRERQQRFRDWMGLDEIEARAEEIEAVMPSNPVVEFDSGQFAHGGVRRITQWLDESALRAVPKSRARKRRTVELDERGEIVWREEVEVSS